MTSLPEESNERQQYIRQQLQRTATWQQAGMKAYTVLMVMLLSAGVMFLAGTAFIPTWREIGCKPMGLDTLFGQITFTAASLTIASIPIGTFIGLHISRRRLRCLIAQLHQAGEKPQTIMTMMTHEGDKNIRRAAEEGLRLLATQGATLSASETLMRAADAPSTAQPNVLLRPAAHTGTPEPTGQLLRPTAFNNGDTPA